MKIKLTFYQYNKIKFNNPYILNIILINIIFYKYLMYYFNKLQKYFNQLKINFIEFYLIYILLYLIMNLIKHFIVLD